MRRLRALVLVLALIGLATNAASGHVVGPATPASTDQEMLQWGVTQGGLTLVVLVVVWSYRRDFLRVFNVERERTDMLLDVVKQATVALTMHSEAAKQQAEAFAKAANSIQLCEAVRDLIRERAEAGR